MKTFLFLAQYAFEIPTGSQGVRFWVLGWAMVLVLATPGFGQTQNTDRAARKAVHAQALADAKLSAARGDFDAAEAALDAANPAPKDTAWWHFDLAQRLTLLASNLSRAGDRAGAETAALRALRSLEHAGSRSADQRLTAGIQQQVGFIQERYFGGAESAKAAYRAAAQLLPNDPALKERLKQIESAEASKRGRGKKG